MRKLSETDLTSGIVQSVGPQLKVLFHDYGGHAHTVRLARALSAVGYRVSYVSFAGFSTPKGKVRADGNDPALFRATELNIAQPFDKDDLIKRMRQQNEYAKLLERFAASEAPDIVISSNSPLEVQETLLRFCRRTNAGFVFWCQDIHSEAIGRILGKKNWLLGMGAGLFYRDKERRLLKQSDALIVIADAFADVLNTPPWSLDRRDIHVVENIAPLDEVPQFPRDNEWAVKHMRPGRKRIVYTGTLARKHNPQLLLELARHVDADVHLFSQGSAPDYVRESAAAEGLDNLFVWPWATVEDLPKVLGAADILYAVIEPDAGVFSVPSKVLSYLAAGRPVLGSIPLDNLAARTVLRADAGRMVAPEDVNGLIATARVLLLDDLGRERMGANGRAYAERTFNVDTVAAKFADVIESVSPAAKLAAQ